MQKGEDSAIRWRLHFAINAIPLMLLFVLLIFFPELTQVSDGEL